VLFPHCVTSPVYRFLTELSQKVVIVLVTALAFGLSRYTYEISPVKSFFGSGSLMNFGYQGEKALNTRVDYLVG
jgi:hypothetical protein